MNLETYGFKIKNNSELFFKKEVVGKLTLVLRDLLVKYRPKINENLARTRQSGSNCYFVAAIELLLSSSTFLKFVEFYSGIKENKSRLVEIEFAIARELKITPPVEFCEKLIQYIKAKNGQGGLDGIYREMEHMLFKDSQFPAEQDDLNVVIIYLQRSFLFNLLYSSRSSAAHVEKGFYMFNTGILYYEQNVSRDICAPFTIILYSDNAPRRSVSRTLAVINDTNVIAVAAKYGGAGGGHYEIYQHIHSHGTKKFIAKNTESPAAIWSFLYVFCSCGDVEEISEKILENPYL